MNGRVGEPQCLLIEAEPRNGRIPEFLNRDTIGPSTEDRPCSVHGEERNQKITSEAHSRRGKDSAVLQENGHFGSDQTGLVDWD